MKEKFELVSELINECGLDPHSISNLAKKRLGISITPEEVDRIICLLAYVQESELIYKNLGYEYNRITEED